jgi:hypothetical protein
MMDNFWLNITKVHEMVSLFMDTMNFLFVSFSYFSTSLSTIPLLQRSKEFAFTTYK